MHLDELSVNVTGIGASRYIATPPALIGPHVSTINEPNPEKGGEHKTGGVKTVSRSSE